MRGLQNSPKPSAWDSRLRGLTPAKAYRARRAPWGQSSHRALSERERLTGTSPAAPRSESARPPRPLVLLYAVLAGLAVVGWLAPPFFGLGS